MIRYGYWENDPGPVQRMYMYMYMYAVQSAWPIGKAVLSVPVVSHVEEH